MRRRRGLRERGKKELMMDSSKRNHTKLSEYKGLAVEPDQSGVKGFEAVEESFDNAPDLVCFSHLRWNFVYQRPQHLLSRSARERRVFYVEEPIFTNDQLAQVDVHMQECGVCVVVPRLPRGLSEDEITAVQKVLIDELFQDCGIRDFILWYYTPMALSFTRHLNAIGVVYDCMDELSAFAGAPPTMSAREAELMAKADVVFTGGQSLYEAKRHQHPNAHPFPSGIDVAHFARARESTTDPMDQLNIPHPRLGYFGVIDERMDIALLDCIAEARPDWHLVMIGPVVKIDPASLPRRPNIHYLGAKDYKELPEYLAGWDVALMPFALNESTRFISPTKTPEYLAAGKPVVSTAIRDVVRPYGEMGLVSIAHSTSDFINACDAELNRKADESVRRVRVDEFLIRSSWDKTWMRMMRLIDSAIAARAAAAAEHETRLLVTKQPAHKVAGSNATGD
jgi:UDP-galactopyranose mutase